MSGQTGENHPDYLIIGHITKDLHKKGYRLGGTVVYSGIIAHRLGLKVAVYTSGASHLALDILDGIDIIDQPGPGTTTFLNEYSSTDRVQRLLDRAEDLDPRLIPERWKQAQIIHLAPVAREIPLSTGSEFPGGLLGYSLQGWMRSWDGEGKISPIPLPDLELPAGRDSVGFLSLEDLGGDRDGLEQIQEQFPNLVLTLGPLGVELTTNARTQQVSTSPLEEIDPTGAGDIFAAAFMILWKLKGLTMRRSAQFANALASLSVRRIGPDGIPKKAEIMEILRDHK